MTTFFETMAECGFLLFLLGAFGIHFLPWIHKMIPKCNAFVFGAICTVLTYLVLTHLA